MRQFLFVSLFVLSFLPAFAEEKVTLPKEQVEGLKEAVAGSNIDLAAAGDKKEAQEKLILRLKNDLAAAEKARDEASKKGEPIIHAEAPAAPKILSTPDAPLPPTEGGASGKISIAPPSGGWTIPDGPAKVHEDASPPSSPHPNDLWLNGGTLSRLGKDGEWKTIKVGANPWIGGAPWRKQWTSISMEVGTFQELVADGASFRWVGKKELKKSE